MKVAVVTVRFGQEVVGGAEKLAWEVSQRLAAEFEIEILTSCAKDYRTWRNHYPEGTSRVDNLLIRRFPVSNERRWKRFGLFSSVLFRLNRVGRMPSLIERGGVLHHVHDFPQLV